MEFYIDNRQDKYIVSEEIESLIEKVILESFKVEGLSDDYEVSISFVDNSEIKLLNNEYRGVDSETDVLSFPMDEDFILPIPLLGDIIISMEKAKEQAEEYGHSLEREVAYLTAHSMFHLMGYDHMNDEEKDIMRLKEKQVMKNLNIYKDEEKE